MVVVSPFPHEPPAAVEAPVPDPEPEPMPDLEQKWFDAVDALLLLDPTLGHPCRGISVHYLVTTLSREIEQAGLPLMGADGCTFLQILDGVVQTKGSSLQCPRDGHIGAAYVDSIGGADCAGLATLFLSCPDDTPVWAAVTALMAHCIEQQLFPKRTYVWISSLCVNFHRTEALWNNRFDAITHLFTHSDSAVQTVLTMMHPWHSPLYFRRPESMLELFISTCQYAVEEPDLGRRGRRRSTDGSPMYIPLTSGREIKVQAIESMECTTELLEALEKTPAPFRSLFDQIQSIQTRDNAAAAKTAGDSELAHELDRQFEFVGQRIINSVGHDALELHTRERLAAVLLQRLTRHCDILLAEPELDIDTKLRRWWWILRQPSYRAFAVRCGQLEQSDPTDQLPAATTEDELSRDVADDDGALSALPTTLDDEFGPYVCNFVIATQIPPRPNTPPPDQATPTAAALKAAAAAKAAAEVDAYYRGPKATLVRASVTTCDLLSLNAQPEEALALADRVIEAIEARRGHHHLDTPVGGELRDFFRSLRDQLIDLDAEEEEDVWSPASGESDAEGGGGWSSPELRVSPCPESRPTTGRLIPRRKSAVPLPPRSPEARRCASASPRRRPTSAASIYADRDPPRPYSALS